MFFDGEEDNGMTMPDPSTEPGQEGMNGNMPEEGGAADGDEASDTAM